MGLSRDRRVTGRREIGELLRGSRARGSTLELYWRSAAEPESRATCVVPKFGHGSVERNRVRRRLQELVRTRILSRSRSRDWLVRARPTAYEASFEDLADELTRLIERAGGTGA